MNKIVIGTAGYGGIAKIHSLAYRSMEIIFDDLPFEISLRKVFRRYDDGKKTPFSNVVTSFDELLGDKDINIIDICTPNNLHYPQVKAAILAGKNIYCEKPLALNYTEALELAQLASQNGITAQSALMMRFLPAVVTAREYIREGKLGEIINFRFQMLHKGYLNENRPVSWRMKSEYSGAGALMDLGIHIIDAVRFMLGDVKSVDALLHTRFKERYASSNSVEKETIDADEYSLLNIMLQNGAIGTVECSRIASQLEEETRIEIYGTLGSIKISTKNPYYPVIHDQKTNITQNGITAKGSSFYDHLMKIYPNEKLSQGQFMDTHIACLYNMFLNAVNGKILYHETPTFMEAARSQEIIDMALKNARIV